MNRTKVKSNNRRKGSKRNRHPTIPRKNQNLLKQHHRKRSPSVTSTTDWLAYNFKSLEGINKTEGIIQHRERQKTRQAKRLHFLNSLFLKFLTHSRREVTF